MPSVVGGVSPRSLAAGQAPVVNPDLLSSATTLQQSGGGGFTKLVDALQSLDQALNIATLQAAAAGQTADIATLQAQVATLQSQVTSINGQIGIINTRLDQLSNSIINLSGQLGGWTFSNVVGAPPAGPVTGSLPAANGGTQYQLPLYA
jgi:hypothetical protein